MTNKLSYFFKPRGVALIGASSNPNKLSHGILKNMISFGYQGAVYPVNPGTSEILGLTCYSEVTDVPDPIDLAVIILPAPAVLEKLEACGKRGIQAVTIISGGFREVGPEGASLEEQCLQVAETYGMRLIGPNCVGTVDLYSGLNTTFIRGLPEKGPIGFVSQSGAICGAVVDYIIGKGIGFSHFISLGNEADVTETDMIEYLQDDDNTRVIATYVEAIRDGQRFIEVAQKVCRKKPVVLLKAGNSEAGARAVSSHTGSLAGSTAAYHAALQQSGVIMAGTAAELFDIAFALASQPLPKGNRVAIVTNSGGPAALASDSLSANGLVLGDLSSQTKTTLREHLVPSAQVNNPIDMLGGASPEEYGNALEAVLADPGIDAALVVQVPTSLVDPVEVAKKIGAASSKTQKTVMACLMGDASIQNARTTLHGLNIPMYIFPEQTGKVFGAMLRYGHWLSVPAEGAVHLSNINRTLAQEEIKKAGAVKTLGEAHVRPVLAAYGVNVIPGGNIVSDKTGASLAAAAIGFPVAMKIVSPDILHKSDAGGILLNLRDKEAVETGFENMMAKIKTTHPKAIIEGVLIEAMAPKGQEVIIGMRRDPQFGPLVMFGLGGVYVELFGDVAFRVAPFTRRDALEMVQQTKAGKLLSGLRGQAPADIGAVVDCILRLGQIALDFPEIDEIEINPLLVLQDGQGAIALDARAILK